MNIVVHTGSSLKEAGSYLTAAVSMGLLKKQTTSATLNLVNAAVFNKEIGIQVSWARYVLDCLGRERDAAE